MTGRYLLEFTNGGLCSKRTVSSCSAGVPEARVVLTMLCILPSLRRIPLVAWGVMLSVPGRPVPPKNQTLPQIVHM